MPPTPKDLLDFLSIYKENSVCYLERVNGMTGQSASASFVFGEGYGQLTMGLIACGIPTRRDRRPREHPGQRVGREPGKGLPQGVPRRLLQSVREGVHTV